MTRTERSTLVAGGITALAGAICVGTFFFAIRIGSVFAAINRRMPDEPLSRWMSTTYRGDVLPQFMVGIVISFFFAGVLCWIIHASRVATIISAAVGCALGLGMLTFAMHAVDDRPLTPESVWVYVFSPGLLGSGIIVGAALGALAGWAITNEVRRYFQNRQISP